MSSKQEDENYWNRSDFKPFSFDDEELSPKNLFFGNKLSSSFVTDIIFGDVSTSQKQEVLRRPLESLISKYSLNKIFSEKTDDTSFKNLSAQEEIKVLRRQIDNQWVPLSVKKTVRLILTGQPYSLHLYRSLSLKKDLLDEAIKCGDGNAILAVVLFLSSTLKKTLFYQILQNRPSAAAHYIQYLTTRMMVSDLIDLLEMLGQAKEAAIKQFTFINEGILNKETKLQRLNTCYNNHFSLVDSKDKLFVLDYIQYLKWFLSLESSNHSSLGNSVLSSLAYLFEHHWNEPKTSKYSPWFFSLQQNVADRQIQWTILNSRASSQSWDDIESYFLTKGWIGGKKLKSVIPIEKIILELNRRNAPYNILIQFLEVITNLEKRLELSKQLSCHKAVIDVYVLMKDRQGIMEYKFNLKPQSEDFLYAENALRTQTKWKN